MSEEMNVAGAPMESDTGDRAREAASEPRVLLYAREVVVEAPQPPPGCVGARGDRCGHGRAEPRAR